MMKRDFGLVYVGKTLSIFQYYDCMLNCTINGKFDRGIMYVSNGNPKSTNIAYKTMLL